MSITENVHVQLMGWCRREKLAALARARALVMPSRHESLSMVVLESWMMERPVLVNGDCEVLRGRCCAREAALLPALRGVRGALDLLLAQPDLADALGRQGRAYFEENYTCRG